MGQQLDFALDPFIILDFIEQLIFLCVSEYARKPLQASSILVKSKMFSSKKLSLVYIWGMTV